jgi:hypothetical protein
MVRMNVARNMPHMNSHTRQVLARSNAALLETLVIGGMATCAVAAIAYDIYVTLG